MLAFTHFPSSWNLLWMLQINIALISLIETRNTFVSKDQERYLTRGRMRQFQEDGSSTLVSQIQYSSCSFMLRFRTVLTKDVSVWSNKVHFFACMWAISKLKRFTFVHSYSHANSPPKRQDFFAQILSFLIQLRMFRIRGASCSPSSKDRLTKHTVVCTWLCSSVLRKNHKYVP